MLYIEDLKIWRVGVQELHSCHYDVKEDKFVYYITPPIVDSAFNLHKIRKLWLVDETKGVEHKKVFHGVLYTPTGKNAYVIATPTTQTILTHPRYKNIRIRIE